MREQNISTKSKLSCVERDTIGHNRREKYAKNEHLYRYKGVSEHISDQLHGTAELVRKSKLRRNDSQSDLSDYTFSSSLLVKFTNILQIHPMDVQSVQNTMLYGKSLQQKMFK